MKASRKLFILALAAHAAMLCVRLARLTFAYDDFLNFEQVQKLGLTWQYLTMPVFGQFVPAFRLLQWSAFHIGGMSIHVYAAITGVFALATTAIFWVLLRRAGQSALRTFGFTLIQASSLQMLHSQLWWSSTCHISLSVLFSLVCLVCLVGPLGNSGPTRNGRAVAGLAFFIAIMFSGRALITPCLFAPILWTLNTRKSIFVVVSSMRWVAAFGILAAAILATMQTPQASAVSMGQIWMFLRFTLVDGTLLPMVGLRASLHAANMLPNFWALVVVLAALSGVFCFRALNRKTVAVWAGYVAFFTAGVTMVALRRAANGIEFSAAGRYNVENSMYLLVVLSLTVPALAKSTKLVAAILAAGAFTALQVNASSTRYNWPIADTSEFVSNVNQALASVPSNGCIAKAALPGGILPAWMWPYNTTTEFVKLFNTKVNTCASNHATHALADNGTLVPTHN